MPSLTQLILRTPFGKALQKSVAAQLNTGWHETDSNFYPGANMPPYYRDRYDYDRQAVFAECLRAWWVNPVARRIVKLISMFVVGQGIRLESDHPATHAFLQEWWNHPLNRLGRKCINFMEEAVRSGNLFFLWSRAL